MMPSQGIPIESVLPAGEFAGMISLAHLETDEIYDARVIIGLAERTAAGHIEIIVSGPVPTHAGMLASFVVGLKVVGPDTCI